MPQHEMNSMIEGTNIELSGGQYNQYNNIQHIHQDAREQKALDRLLEQTSQSASYNSKERYDPPKCHPDTRVALLDDLIIRMTTAVVACMIWLYGPAGAGKSAIAQSVAEICAAKALLLGSFFFFRASTSRNSVEPLGATLVYQLTQSIPSTLPYVLNCISRDPRIFDTHLENQLMKLFVEPLRQAMNADHTLKSHPRVIIIDGLDECRDPQVQKAILAVFEKILHTSPIPLVILVGSRPENHIQSAFHSVESQSSVPLSRIGLHEQAEASDDIRLFLNSKFSTIKQTHALRIGLPIVWPTPTDIDIIVKKSSGQFIYAATIVRYVESDQHNPQRRLEAALNAPQLNSQHKSPFEALDALYTQIFSGVTDEDLLTTLAILYLRLCGFDDQSRGRVSSPNGIEYFLHLEPGAVHEHLSPLASLVEVTTVSNNLTVFHASLEDFLFDATRSRTLHVDQPAVHYLLCNACLTHATKPNATITSTYCAMKCLLLHARIAGTDNLVCHLGEVTEVEERLLRALLSGENPYDHGYPRYWGHTHQPPKRVDDLIQFLHEFWTIIDPRINARFWSKWVQQTGRHIFTHELSVFLVNNHHDALAFIAFMDEDMWGLWAFVFAPTVGVPSSQWNDYQTWFHYSSWRSNSTHWNCQLNLPSNSELVNDIIRQFLRSKELSGDLFIDDSTFVRLAIHCATLIRKYNRPHISFPGSLTETHSGRIWAQLTEEDFTFWWGIRGLTCMLQVAPADPLLVKELKCIKVGSLPWRDHASIKDVDYVIRSYLNKPADNPGFRSRLKQRVRTVIQKFS